MTRIQGKPKLSGELFTATQAACRLRVRHVLQSPRDEIPKGISAGLGMSWFRLFAAGYTICSVMVALCEGASLINIIPWFGYVLLQDARVSFSMTYIHTYVYIYIYMLYACETFLQLRNIT